MLATAAHANADQVGRPHYRAYEALDHQPIGEPANGTSATEVIDVTIKETKSGYMLFQPDVIAIKTGSVVRFVIRNDGALDHEFYLGSFDEVAKHQQWMRKYPDMAHDEANSVTVPSGGQSELVWTFSSTTNLEFVCLVPGHREAGMWGVILVHDHLTSDRKSENRQ